MKRLGISYKKTLKAQEQDRAEVKAQRKHWQDTMMLVDIKRLIFLDESGAKTNMTRLYGRCDRSERLNMLAPRSHWCSTTMLAAIGFEGIRAAMICEGAMNSCLFEGFIEQFLGPHLRPGDWLIMDNFSSHKSNKVQELVRSKGTEVCYLPPYSPDLNPIEKMWSKVKSILRKLEARTHDELHRAIGYALEQVTSKECINYFVSCGYCK